MIESFKKAYFCIFNARNMNDFEDIRSYRDEEIPAAMQRIAHDAALSGILKYFDFEMEEEQFRQVLCNIKTVNEFQIHIVKRMVEKILQKTTDGLSNTGFENLDPKGHYLFVSNHRDIVLDAMFMDYVLAIHDHPLFNIAFGSNLVFNQLANDFAKSNKMFQMKRGGNRIEFYNELAHTSDYIRHLLVEKHESVWIAQRNGRTKDGLDLTDPVVIKMLGMSRRDDRITSLAELHIVPVSLSYEWESCDMLKTMELYVSRFQKYEKKPGEDLNSTLTGVKQLKGRVHLHFGSMLSKADLEKWDACSSGEFYKKVAEWMDHQICGNYVLWPNNYIAHDLRSGTETYANHYTLEQKNKFLQHLAWIEKHDDLDRELLQSIFLGIYANPVDKKDI